MRGKRYWKSVKFLLPVIILLLVTAMVCYNVLDSQNVNFEGKSVMSGNINLTEDFRRWVAGNDKIFLAYDDESIPFIGVEGQETGFFADYFDTISEILGAEIVLTRVENGKMRELTDSGEIHCGISIADNGQGDGLLTSMPIIPVKGVICARADSDIKSEKAFRESRIVAVKSSAAARYLEANGISGYLQGDSVAEGMGMAVNGEADCFIGNEGAIREYLTANGLTEAFVIVDGYAYSGNYCVTFPAGSPLYSVINDVIYNMDEDAVIAELQGKWQGLSYALHSESAARQTVIIFIILMTSILCVFCLFYMSNRGIYAELNTRAEVLLENKRELDATFDGVTYFIAEVDSECRVLTLNKAFLQQINIVKRDAVGRLITEFLDVAPSRKGEDELIGLIEKTFGRDEKQSGEFFSGKKIFNIHIFPINAGKGQAAKALLMIMDVTRERNVERQSMQDSKMIAVGQLASGVAHEIRNPLGVIMNYCYVLKNLDTGDEKSRLEAIGIIEKSVKRSGKIIDNLLNFSRLSSDRKERVILKRHIEAILSLHVNFSDKNNINVDFTCPDDIVLYTASDSLDMILENLISNAADAINGNGTIIIRCAQNAGDVIIEVFDNGEGIPGDIIEEIYNPFFTTKPRKRGSGLGLYIVYSELQKLNGDITVESEPGAGTVFTVTLPRGDINE